MTTSESSVQISACGMCLVGSRVTVRTLRREDLEEMDNWCASTDPLLVLWGVPNGNPASRSLWFSMHASDPTRLWYAVERHADGHVLGTVSLREIVDQTSARLGISLDPACVDQGYGTESLELFFPYYFEALGFQRLVLDVAGANRRAVHVYEKLGFAYTGSHYRDVTDDADLGFLNQGVYSPLRAYFRRHLGHQQMLFYDMALERSSWQKRLQRGASSV
jgi:diamine N-acetyltransferase